MKKAPKQLWFKGHRFPNVKIKWFYCDVVFGRNGNVESELIELEHVTPKEMIEILRMTGHLK